LFNPIADHDVGGVAEQPSEESFAIPAANLGDAGGRKARPVPCESAIKSFKLNRKSADAAGQSRKSKTCGTDVHVGSDGGSGEEKGSKDGSKAEIKAEITSMPTCSALTFESPTTSGARGLRNLGNTCFMNCILQCLSNTKPLRDFFLSGLYERDINRSNPLGAGGVMAREYAKLQKELWANATSAVAPVAIKRVIGKMNSSFAGLNQQDAQELMGFLLDYLHEDLNRIEKKPYIEEVDTSGVPDEKLAADSWSDYKRRNDSMLDNIFQGQERSQLTCPKCGFVSVKFDNFSVLSLPLPQRTKLMTAYLLDPDTNEPVSRWGLRVPLIGQLSMVSATLSALAKIPVAQLQLCAVFEGKIVAKNNTDRIERFPSGAQIVAVVRQSKSMMIAVVQFEKKVVSSANCKVCGKLEIDILPVPKLKACSKCANAFYCSPDCQRADWGVHKRVCKKSAEVPFGLPFFVPKTNSDGTMLSYSALKRRASQLSARLQPTPASDVGRILSQRTVTGSAIRVSKTSPIWSASTSSEPAMLEHVDCVGLTWKVSTEELKEVVPEYLDDESLAETPEDQSSNQQTPSLDACFRKYQKPEILEETEMWYCSKCEKHQQAEKQLSLWTAPEVLVLHLKRFSFRNILWKDKLDFRVDFPAKGLDIAEYVARSKGLPVLYDLYAVAHHHGLIWGGHYTAHAKSAGDGKWRQFDDSQVVESSEGAASSSKDAYVLFYQKRKEQAAVNCP
jgi:ubiquitin C-terminal hydrolase